MADWLILCGTGLLAGVMNATAGGGTFVTLPVLIGFGVPSVAANASSTIALYPGGIMSSWVYRSGLSKVCGVPLRPTLVATLFGGLAGALLLLFTPSAVFDRVLPWLLLAATLAIAFGRRLGPLLRARFRAGTATVLLIQVALGIYGGYFGGAVGLMMMAAWSLLDEVDIKALNAPRTLLVVAANTVAVLCFVVAGIIRWPQALSIAAGALAGGYIGAHIGNRLPAAALKAVTVAFASAMTAHFFIKAYGHA